MLGKHTEQAFEAAIEYHLITAGGYEKGYPDKFDRERCLFPQDVLAFIQETQPKEWAYLEKLQKDRAEETLLDDLCRALDSPYEGCLSVLRHGAQVLREAFPCRLFRSGKQPQPGDAEALRRQPSHYYAPASLFEPARQYAGCSLIS